MNGIVLVNAWVHDPHVGYDAWDHLRYVETLSDGRLPLPGDTREFFSPPAPYALPALLRARGLAFPFAAKLAQLQNVLWSVGLTACLMLWCRRLRPGSPRFELTALALLGMLPVYYKSFAQVRGEPLLAFLALASLVHALGLFLDPRWRLRPLLLTGFLLGAAGLARQWGLLLYPALGLFALALAGPRLRPRGPLLAKLAALTLLALLLSGWFYARHQGLFGSAAAFNREPGAFSLAAQPRSFYLGLGDGKLFSSPVRQAFPNQLWPILHSEVWGDYWGYFTAREMPWKPLHAGRAHVGSNLETMAPYLGRVNAFSLLPALVYAAGFWHGAGRLRHLLRSSAADPDLTRTAGLALAWLAVACTLTGYAVFLIRYPDLESGDTLKATYLLQIFPFAALLAADFLERLRRRWRAGHAALVAALLAVAAHNLPALFTRYPGARAGVAFWADERWRAPSALDAAGRTGGIKAEYFRGERFGQRVAARAEPGIDLLTAGAAAPGAGADHFSVRFQGFLFFPADGRYWLCEESDDGARLRFDGQLLIDDWAPHAHRTVCEPVRVREGWHPLELEYYDLEGAAVLRLLRGSDRRALRTVPPGHLCCRPRAPEAQE